MSIQKHVEHESTSAAAEIIAPDGRVRTYGYIASAAAYRQMLAVYRMHGTDVPKQTRSLEYFYAAKGVWITAERRLQKLSLEEMIRMARANPAFYRVVTYDYAGRTVFLDAANTKLRGEI